MMDFAQAAKRLEPIITEDNGAGHVALKGVEYTLADGSSLWVNKSGEYKKRFASLSKSEQNICGHIEKDADFQRLQATLDTLVHCSNCAADIDPDQASKVGSIGYGATDYYCDGDCLDTHNPDLFFHPSNKRD